MQQYSEYSSHTQTVHNVTLHTAAALIPTVCNITLLKAVAQNDGMQHYSAYSSHTHQCSAHKSHRMMVCNITLHTAVTHTPMLCNLTLHREVTPIVHITLHTAVTHRWLPCTSHRCLSILVHLAIHFLHYQLSTFLHEI